MTESTAANSGREKFTDYAAWLKRCIERGDNGPYGIDGQGQIEQFVRPGEGTSAIWNHTYRVGYVFQWHLKPG